MVQLLEHYFAEQSSAQTRHRLMRRRSHDEQRSWRYLDIINRMIDTVSYTHLDVYKRQSLH